MKEIPDKVLLSNSREAKGASVKHAEAKGLTSDTSYNGRGQAMSSMMCNITYNQTMPIFEATTSKCYTKLEYFNVVVA